MSRYVFKELYELGARRIAVFGAPPLGCLPSLRTLAGGVNRQCSEKHNKAAKLFNTKLFRMLHALHWNLLNSRMVYIDIYYPLLDLIENPHKYGKSRFLFCSFYNFFFFFLTFFYFSCHISNMYDAGFEYGDRGCCGTGNLEVAILCNPTTATCMNVSQYVFWDSYHPTEGAYKALFSGLVPKYMPSLFFGK